MIKSSFSIALKTDVDNQGLLHTLFSKAAWILACLNTSTACYNRAVLITWDSVLQSSLSNTRDRTRLAFLGVSSVWPAITLLAVLVRVTGDDIFIIFKKDLLALWYYGYWLMFLVKGAQNNNSRFKYVYSSIQAFESTRPAESLLPLSAPCLVIFQFANRSAAPGAAVSIPPLWLTS